RGTGSSRSSHRGSRRGAARAPRRSTSPTVPGDLLRSPALRVLNPLPDQVDQPELADLHLVAVGQHGAVHRLAVDVGAVEAAHVDDLVAAVDLAELRMPAADGHVVEEDVAGRVPSGGGGLLIEQEARTGVRSTPHHQQCRTGGQSLDPAERGVDLLSRRIDLVEEVRAENRRRLDRGLDSRVLVLLAHRFSFVRLADLAPSSAASAELSSPRRYPATPTVFTL